MTPFLNLFSHPTLQNQHLCVITQKQTKGREAKTAENCEVGNCDESAERETVKNWGDTQAGKVNRSETLGQEVSKCKENWGESRKDITAGR